MMESSSSLVEETAAVSRSVLTEAQGLAAAWKLGPLAPNPLQRQGAYLSDRAGSSTEFLDQRPFARGDDIRHINWQAYGRTEQVIVNLYQQESAPLLDIILDCTPSMHFDLEKWKHAWTVWTFFSALAIDAGARVRNFLVRGDACLEATWNQPQSTLPILFNQEDVSSLKGLLKSPLSGRSFRVFISDLLIEVGSEDILRALSRNAGGLAILAPFTDVEAAPDWTGNIQFKDVEGAASISHLCDNAFSKRYQKRYQAHFSAWQEAVERRSGALCRMDVATPFAHSIAKLFVRSGLVLPR